MLINKSDKAQHAGMHDFDCTLPQSWLDDAAIAFATKLGGQPGQWYDLILATTVWCYDAPHAVFGAPRSFDPLVQHALNTITNPESQEG